MDALPPGGLPQPYVSPEDFAAYQAEANSFAADRVVMAEAGERRWRRIGLASQGLAAAALLAASVVIARHTEHTNILAYDSRTGFVGLVKPVEDVAMTLPQAVDDYFEEQYVELREGFVEASAGSAFDAVVCMSDRDEQKRYADWFNNSPTAPQQVFAAARNHGFRTVTVATRPGTIATLPHGARRIEMRFKYQDSTSSPMELWGTARFNVAKRLAAVRSCNPAGLVVSDYESVFDAAPPSPGATQ